MVMRTIEIKQISFEVEKERQEEVKQRIRTAYPDLEIEVDNDTISVSGDLRNYRKRDNLLFIMSGGEHGQSV
jgi:hypothetical protein